MCRENDTCIKCNEKFFLLSNESQCIPYSKLLNCNRFAHSGCVKCAEGYYVKNKYCSLRSESIRNCSTCTDGAQCKNCFDGYVLNEDGTKCIYYKDVKHCTQADNNK